MRGRTRRQPDALVIGAGIAGVASACFLAKAGLIVDIVETHHPAWGASGRNPGLLWLQTKPAGFPMTFAMAGRNYAEALAGELPDFGFRGCGGLIIYRDEALADVATAFVEDRNSAGLPTRHVTGQEARELCPSLSARIVGAIWNPLDAHQDTRGLVKILCAEAEAAGCRVRAGRPALRLLMPGERCSGAILAGGEQVNAGTTVVAAGPQTNELLKPLGLEFPMVPMRFEAAETAPAPFEIGPVICGQALFKFFNTVGKGRDELPSHPAESIRPDLGFTEQIAQFPGGSLQFGCAFEAGATDDRPTSAGQRIAETIMRDNIAGFAALPVERTWAGIVGQTPDGLPVVDAHPGIDGLAINAGHFFGNLVGVLSGRMLADVCLGNEPIVPAERLRLRRFSGFGRAEP